jgi:hypothetical protein
MICPKGEAVHENLSSEYTDVPQLLSSLRTERFSGTVEIETTTKKGLFLLSSGEIVEAIVGTEAEPAQTEGNEAVEELLVFCTQPSVVLNIYRLSNLEVEFAAGTVHAETVFKGLSTDFVRLDRFIKKLEGEKHTGYIEAFTKDNIGVGMLLLKDGVLEGAFVAFGSGRLDFRKGDAAKAFLEEMNSRSLVFSVYRSTLPALKETSGGKGIEEAGVEREVNGVVTLPNTNGKIVDTETVRPDILPNAPTAIDGRNRFLSDVQGVLGRLEGFVVGLSDEKGFQRVFKRACVEKSDFYPFLDPFEGQFDYSEGVIRVDSQISVESLSAGLAECLNLTLSYLQNELLISSALPSDLRDDIDAAFAAYPDCVENSANQSIGPTGLQ